MKMFIGIALLFLNFYASAENNVDLEKISKDPEYLVTTVVSGTLNIISANESVIKENPNYVKDIVEENLMPYVSDSFASYYVLGNHFRKFSKDEILSFTNVFRDYISYSVADLFKLYQDQEIKYYPYKETDAKTTTVSFDIIDKNRPDIRVDALLRKMRDDNWFIYDLRFEGISMLSSKRTEFSPILRKDGIQSLIDDLSKYKDLDIKLED